MREKKRVNLSIARVFERINTSIVRAMRERFLKLYHGDPMSISTANHIYGELRKRGYSVRNWAIERGFSPRTVQECIHTYAPCKHRAASRWHCLIEDHGGIE